MNDRLPKNRALYYGGRWVESKAQKSIPVIAPATGESLGNVIDASADDVDHAVKAARGAFHAWRDTPAQERAKAVRRAAQILVANADELAWLEALDTGNPFQAMRFDDRLTYELHIEPIVGDCLVPVFLLQPIIENAVIHGLDAGQASITVRIDATATSRGVELTVQNNGSEVGSRSGGARGHGLGIATTRARLSTAYGQLASLELLPRENGGAVVRIVIPRTQRSRIEREANHTLALVGSS